MRARTPRTEHDTYGLCRSSLAWVNKISRRQCLNLKCAHRRRSRLPPMLIHFPGHADGPRVSRRARKRTLCPIKRGSYPVLHLPCLTSSDTRDSRHRPHHPSPKVLSQPPLPHRPPLRVLRTPARPRRESRRSEAHRGDVLPLPRASRRSHPGRKARVQVLPAYSRRRKPGRAVGRAP